VQELTFEQLERYRQGFESDPAARAANAAMAKTELADLAYIPMNAARLMGDFTIEVKTNGITAQEKSGRCWMFAVMNILREVAAEKLGVEEFEFSENYLAFYDKLEKTNNYLEMIIENADEKLDAHIVEHLLTFGFTDGGYWEQAVELIKKYGLVPKYVMPESYQSSHTEKFMKLLNNTIRSYAAQLRKLRAEGADRAALEEAKDHMMAAVYKAECIVFGEPVKTFTFEYRDAKDQYHADYGLTPLEFYDKYVGFDLDQYVTVMNAPTEKMEIGKYYVFHNMCCQAGMDLHALNLTAEEMEELSLKQLKDGIPVWFGCDSGAFGDRKMGVWDPDSFDYQGLLGGMDWTMEKKDRLDYKQSWATHAMILVGVNLDQQGKPDRWKIENSWGKDVGKNGYFVASEKYFREYVYEVIINRKYLNDEQLRLLETEPVRLEPWEA
jgi:bleomycin hydrolase